MFGAAQTGRTFTASEGAVAKNYKLWAVQNQTRAHAAQHRQDALIVKRFNCMRQASGGALWKLWSEAYICNSHYEGFKGPSRAKPNVLPTLFKRPQRKHISLSHTHLLERPELSSTLSDTSVEDHESEECDTRLATLERDFPRLQEEFLQTKAHGKLVHAAGETSARVNSKAVT